MYSFIGYACTINIYATSTKLTKAQEWIEEGRLAFGPCSGKGSLYLNKINICKLFLVFLCHLWTSYIGPICVLSGESLAKNASSMIFYSSVSLYNILEYLKRVY